MKRILTLLLLVTIPLSTSALSEFEKLLNSYGTLLTAAGKGEVRTNGVNSWTPSMEGGDATEAELSRPHMAMADRQGNIFIADKDAHAIRKVAPDGKIHTVAGTNVPGFNGDGIGVETQLNQPNGLYTFPDGTTYILDMGNARIRKLSTSGNLTTIIEDPDGILIGRGLWVSRDETLIYYVSYETTGVVKKWTQAQGLTTYAANFVEPGNIAVDPTDKNLVVTDRGANRVYRVFPDGTNQPIAGNGLTTGGGDGFKALETALNGVRAICFAPNGAYFLGTHEGSQVWYVDTNGYIHLFIDGDENYAHSGDGESIKTPGHKISQVRSVTLAPDGDLIVTENDYGYVRVAEKILTVLEATLDDAGAFTLTWSSVPETTYAIQFKTDLTQPLWENLHTLPANPSDITTSFTHAAPSAPKTFYRILLAR